MRNQRDMYNKPKKEMERPTKKKASTADLVEGNHPTPKKSLSPKQKAIAKKAGNPNKIDAADLAALRKKKKKK